jgi:hypothetical protein
LNVLKEIGEPETLREKNKTFPFYLDLPIELEVGRPPQYHQTVPFVVREPEIGKRPGTCEIEFLITGFPEKSWLQVTLNGRAVPASLMTWRRRYDSLARGGPVPTPIRTGHDIGPHYQSVILRPPAGWVNCGSNSLQFYLAEGPRYEHTYITVYEMEVRAVYQ